MQRRRFFQLALIAPVAAGLEKMLPAIEKVSPRMAGAVVTLIGGSITAITITNAGLGYTSSPTVLWRQ